MNNSNNSIGTKKIRFKILSFILRHIFNIYPFGPEVGLENSLRFTAHLLDEGYSLVIFPEGGRTRNGKMHEFKEGVGFLSVNMGTKILPIKTEGLFKILPYYKSLPKFGEVLVKIGKPFTIGKISYFKAAKMIEKKVKSL